MTRDFEITNSKVTYDEPWNIRWFRTTVLDKIAEHHGTCYKKVEYYDQWTDTRLHNHARDFFCFIVCIDSSRIDDHIHFRFTQPTMNMVVNGIDI